MDLYFLSELMLVLLNECVNSWSSLFELNFDLSSVLYLSSNFFSSINAKYATVSTGKKARDAVTTKYIKMGVPHNHQMVTCWI